MTYLQFLALFILPPLTALLVWPPRRFDRRVRLALLAQPVIALAYTTPWDNYLVASGIWAYGADRVVGTIGWVPVEEYLFFLLQPLLGAAWLLRWRLHEVAPIERSVARAAGAALWLLVALGGALALGRESTRYFGLILAWAAPVLALQWWFTGDVVVRSPLRYLAVVAGPVLYLWLADAVAIRAGIWHISERFTIGVTPFGLPVEEMAFFLVTHLLSVHGALLFLQPARFALPFRAGAR